MNLKVVFERSYSYRSILILGTLFVVVNSLTAVANGLAGLDYPFNSFLFFPSDRFGDFFKVIDSLLVVNTWDGENPYKDSGMAYYHFLFPCTATNYLLFAHLIKLTGSKFLVYITLSTIVFGSVVLIARKYGASMWTIPLLLVSYPVIVVFDRGNLAMVVFLMVMIAMTCNRVALSTLALAVAVSMKFTPIIFIIGIVLQREISVKNILTVGASLFFWLVVVNTCCILINGYYLTPHVYDPVFVFSATLDTYWGTAINRLAGLAYNNSLFMPLAYIATKLGYAFDFFVAIKPIYLPLAFYWVVALILLFKAFEDLRLARNQARLFVAISISDFAIVLLATKKVVLTFALTTASMLVRCYRANIQLLLSPIRKFVFFDKFLFVLSITFVLFMPVTADYYLLIMFIPLLLSPGSQYSFSYFVVYGMLLGAKNFVYLDKIAGNFVSLQVFINPILLLLMLLAEFGLVKGMSRLAAVEQPLAPLVRSSPGYAD